MYDFKNTDFKTRKMLIGERSLGLTVSNTPTYKFIVYLSHFIKVVTMHLLQTY